MLQPTHTVSDFPLLCVQLCLVRFTPPGFGERRHRLVCVLNNDPGSTQEAELLGQGAVPAIRVSGGGREDGDERSLSQVDSFGSSAEGELERGKRATIYMRPTCVGIASSGSVQVKSFFHRGALSNGRIASDCRRGGVVWRTARQALLFNIVAYLLSQEQFR